jgi:hypothetical protein
MLFDKAAGMPRSIWCAAAMTQSVTTRKVAVRRPILVARGGLAPIISPQEVRSVAMVGARVVHTVGAAHWKYGLPLTGLGNRAPSGRRLPG